MPEAPLLQPMVKICGLVRPEDAWRAASAGADFVGGILTAGFPRSTTPEVVRDFTNEGGPQLVGVLVDEPTARAVELGRAAGVAVLQLSGEETPEQLDALRDAGDWGLWKALRPRTPDELRRGFERYAGHAHGILLDGWHPTARGGAGVRVGWDVVEIARDEVPDGTLLVLAGGLTPENVAEAVARTLPDVVDVSSGVEAEVGRKDPDKMERFVRAARGAVTSRGSA